jgi:hypothetical protein
MAYGPRFVTLYRQHSRQLVKVLEGTSPSDIPLLNSPTSFKQIINLRIAQACERAAVLLLGPTR